MVAFAGELAIKSSRDTITNTSIELIRTTIRFCLVSMTTQTRFYYCCYDCQRSNAEKVPLVPPDKQSREELRRRPGQVGLVLAEPCVFTHTLHPCMSVFSAAARLSHQCTDQLMAVQAELQDSVKEVMKSRKKYQEAETVAQAVREKAELDAR